MKFNLKLSLTQINSAYQTALQDLSSSVTLKGFRKGKAPLKLVEETADRNKLYEKALMKVFVPVYNAYVDKNGLKPITMPRLNLLSANEKEDWEVEVEIAQKPTVDLNDYEAVVKKLPKKAEHKHDHEPNHDHEHQDRLNQILETLLTTCKVEPPSLLVDEETNRALSRLLEQLQKLNLNLEQYATSLGKKVDDLKAEYTNTSRKNIALDFIIEEIAQTQKLIALDTEVEQFINSIKDAKTQADAKASSYARASFKDMLTRQKVVDFLLSL